MVEDRVQLWLVERTYSDDEQNIIILTYATPDGTHYQRKERALTSFDDAAETTAAIEADAESVGVVHDDARQERYAAEASRMAEIHDPDDTI